MEVRQPIARFRMQCAIRESTLSDRPPTAWSLMESVGPDIVANEYEASLRFFLPVMDAKPIGFDTAPIWFGSRRAIP